MTEQTNQLPEAGGVAWTEIWSRSGVKVSVTGRGFNAAAAIDDLYAGIAHAVKEYGCVTNRDDLHRPVETPAVQVEAQLEPQKPKAQAVSEAGPQVLPGEDTVEFQVSRIEAQQTPKGAAMFKVFGGRYEKFGATCWPEIMAERYEVEGLPVGTTWTPDAPLVAVVLLNEKGNPQKVVAWK